MCHPVEGIFYTITVQLCNGGARSEPIALLPIFQETFSQFGGEV